MKQVLLTLIVSSLITSCAALPLTVNELVEEPSEEMLKQVVEARGGVYTPEVGESIRTRQGQILQGTLFIPQDASIDPSAAQQQAALKALGTLFTTTKLGKRSATALARIQRYLPSLTYAALAKGALEAWQDVHTSITTQKAQVSTEDEALMRNQELSIAHHFAVDLVVHLVLLMYSPKAHPCERMYSLYLLNTLHLLGSQGLALHRHRARANRFYFDSKGFIKGFDPAKGNHIRPKRIKALIKFLRTICHNRQEYCNYLAIAAEYGITGINKYRNQPWQGRSSTFGWRYAAGLFKALSSIDVIKIRTVDPTVIFSNTINHDVLQMMILCSQQDIEGAEQLVKSNHYSPGTTPKVMERYIKESLKQIPLLSS